MSRCAARMAESTAAYALIHSTATCVPDYNGKMLVFFVITVAAAEVAVGLAIIVALYRTRQTIHTDELDSLKG